MDSLSGRLQRLQEEVRGRLDAANADLAVKRSYERDHSKAVASLSDAANKLENLEQTCVVLQAIEESQRQELQQKIENLVSYGLSAVFGKPYKFKLKMTQRGQQTDCDFLVEVPEMPGVEIPLRDAHGGGLVSITSFLFQMIVTLSSKPPLRRFIVHDEPFSMVSEEFKQKLVDFLRELADKADVQFLFISHDPEMVSVGDKRYRFKIAGGLTEVERLD